MPNQNNVLGPGSIFQPLPEGQQCDYEQKFSFNKKAFEAFIAQCNQIEKKQQLSQSQFLQQCLSPDDFKKLSSPNSVDQKLAAKIAIAINNSAGHVTDDKSGHHIGQKPFDIGGIGFAGAFFNLVGVSTDRTLYLEQTEIVAHRNTDGNIFGDKRSAFQNSLQEREAVVKVQLQAAIDDLLDKKDSAVKQDIQAFLDILNTGVYPDRSNPNDKQKAQNACDLANLVRAINIAKEGEIAVFQRPNLFNVIQEKSEIFSQRVQAVVDATNKPIIVGKELYQPNKDKVLLGNFNGKMCDITNSDHIRELQEAAETGLGKSEIKLVLSINGATHQMAKDETIESFCPSVGGNFAGRVALEEAVRKAQQTRVYNKKTGEESVSVSYSIDGGQSIDIGRDC